MIRLSSVDLGVESSTIQASGIFSGDRTEDTGRQVRRRNSEEHPSEESYVLNVREPADIQYPSTLATPNHYSRNTSADEEAGACFVQLTGILILCTTIAHVTFDSEPIIDRTHRSIRVTVPCRH
jgi:hypothetical protein